MSLKIPYSKILPLDWLTDGITSLLLSMLIFTESLKSENHPIL